MDVEKVVFKIICSHISDNVISPEIKLEEINFDSVTFMKIIVALETKFDFEKMKSFYV